MNSEYPYLRRVLYNPLILLLRQLCAAFCAGLRRVRAKLLMLLCAGFAPTCANSAPRLPPYPLSALKRDALLGSGPKGAEWSG